MKNTTIKMLLLVYWISCLIGFVFGVKIGVVTLLILAPIPLLIIGMYNAIAKKERSEIFVLPIWVLAIVIALVVWNIPDKEKDTVVTDSEIAEELQPSETSAPATATPIVQTEAPSEKPTAVAETTNEEADTTTNGDDNNTEVNNEIMVYKSKSSKKFHKKECRYYKESYEEMTYDDAIEMGYEPCKVCFK